MRAAEHHDHVRASTGLHRTAGADDQAGRHARTDLNETAGPSLIDADSDLAPPTASTAGTSPPTRSCEESAAHVPSPDDPLPPHTLIAEPEESTTTSVPRPKEWSGGFTPFSVGDPGRAAGMVRPIPDPTEWSMRDTVLDGVCVRDHADEPALELRAASVRGLSHRFAGTVRQDSYAYRCTRDGRYLVAAVSDGVSNSKLSHYAANLITQRGCDELAKLLEQQSPDQLAWVDLVHSLADQVVQLGRELLGDRTREASELTRVEVAGHLAATALFAVIAVRPGHGEIPVHLFAIGDSAAWVLRGGMTWEPQQTLKNEGNTIASSRVKAIPLLPAELDPPVATTLRPADVLVMMTDGIGDPLGDGSGSVGRFLAEVWTRPPAPLGFAAHVDFARRTHDDDRTALAIWPERGP